MNFKKIILILAIFIFPAGLFAQNKKEAWQLLFFHTLTCHKCVAVKSSLMPEVERRFKDNLTIAYRDLGDIENYKLLLSLKERYGLDSLWETPIIFFAGHFLSGESQIRKNLIPLIESVIKGGLGKKELGGVFDTFDGAKPRPLGRGLKAPLSINPERSRRVDLLTHFRSFTPLAVLSAGLIDGINPCAFTVLVFFISFLALQGYRKRELAAVGLAFIFAVFLTYIFIGIGLLGFLYRLKGFWLASKIANISIGGFSILLGIFAVYDFFKFKQTKNTEGLVLQLPQKVKEQIHKVIGWHYRRAKEEKIGSPKVSFIRLIISALVCGFLVSILEAVCTGQVYLPTISFVLKATHLKFEALGYLLLYNLMFIVPLLAIFVFALLGATSEQFSKFLKHHLLTLKILMAVLFFTLGLFLIWRA